MKRMFFSWEFYETISEYFVYHICKSLNRPPLWSSGQSFWLQIQRSVFDSRYYQIFWVVGLERGALSLVSTIEELLERKNSGSGLETEITAVGIRRADHATPLYPLKLALTSPTSGGRSVYVFLSRTKATELLLVMSLYNLFFCNPILFAVCTSTISK
jgi:hypothetical protein